MNMQGTFKKGQNPDGNLALKAEVITWDNQVFTVALLKEPAVYDNEWRVCAAGAASQPSMITALQSLLGPKSDS